MGIHDGHGTHLMLDFYDCNIDKLKDKNSLEQFLNDVPPKIGMQKSGEVFTPREDGVSGVIMLLESHCSIHTYLKFGLACLDVYSCKPFDTEELIAYGMEYFEATEYEKKVITRGKKFSPKK